jgi:hypothetical protein
MEDLMSTMSNLSTHRHWEDWCSMVVGLLILISPAIAQTADSPQITLNAVVIGLLVVFLGWQELMLLETWEEWIELVAGLWLVASPWVFGYSDLGFLTAMHVALGSLVAALAVLELWQDWKVARPTH